MKWIILLIILLPILYIGNYVRLSHLKPPPSTPRDIDFNTTHSIGETLFKPTTFNMDTHFTKVSDEVTYMGTHYTSIERMFKPFDPTKPTGYMTWRGKIVGYFYSSAKPINDYHWHYHKNFCMREGLAVTTKLSGLECVLRGYYYWPNFANRYMLHYWLNGRGNELYNEALK